MLGENVLHVERNGNSPYGGRYSLTRHVRQRLDERALTLTDLRAALSVGRVRHFQRATYFVIDRAGTPPPRRSGSQAETLAGTSDCDV